MRIPETFKRKLATSASAGTGKTFKLAVRYISILMLGGRTEEIYALTFTNKAAYEMEDRIQSIIMNPSKHKAEVKDIAETIGNKVSTTMKKLYKLRKEFLSNETHITTIDAFTSSILRSFGKQIGISSNFEAGNLSAETEVAAFIKYLEKNKSIDSLVAFSEATDDKISGVIEGFNMLNSVEKEIKDTVAKYILDTSKENPYDKLNEVERKIENSVNLLKMELKKSGNATDKMIDTFSYEEIKDLTSKAFMSRDTLNYSTYKKAFNPKVDMHFNDIKKYIANWFMYREMLFIHQLIKLYGDFKEATADVKFEKGILTFNDIVNNTVDVMANPDLEYLRFRLDSSMKHLLIDEFQDTSWSQYQILNPIIREITQNQDSEFRSFFFVGDTKQSIYRFRGGNVSLFQKAIDEMQMETDTLAINYRSTQAVVNFTNEVFMCEYKDYPKQIASRKDEGIVSIVTSDNPYAEIGKKVQDKLKEGKSPGSIAVLVFTNKEVLEAEQEIAKVNPNVEIVTDTSSKIMENKSVSAIAELLRFQQTGEEFYLLSFYSMMGGEVKKENDLKFLMDAFSGASAYLDNPAKYIKSLVSQIDMFNGDLNVLKFIEIASKFSSIEDLYMNIETIMEPVLNPEDAEGIRVLTIHKAKGLEFDNVIVLDRKITGAKNHKQLFFEYDQSANVTSVWHRFSKREIFDINYREAEEKEKARERNDELNVLYVAFTRAGTSLDIIRYADKSKLSMLTALPLENNNNNDS